MRKLKNYYSQPATTGNSEERTRRTCARSGHAVVEMALMAPWIFLLFIMVFDLGFYNYAAIATANAARAGMIYATQMAGPVYDVASLRTPICSIVARELQGMPNVSRTTGCVTDPASITDAAPIALELPPTCTGPDSQACAIVAVTYRSPQLFPIPGLMGRMTLKRVAEGRIRDN